MLVMLMFVTVVMKDYVHTEPSSESDFYEQLFKKTFYQDSLKKFRSEPSRFEDEKHKKQILNKQTLLEKIASENVPQKITASQNMTQQTLTPGNNTQKTSQESRKNECAQDGKKCLESEVDFMDREDHNIQLVDEMFVNTDNEITSIQASEVEDPEFSSVSDSQNAPAQNPEVEETLFSR